jgi:hypothetical protein
MKARLSSRIALIVFLLRLPHTAGAHEVRPGYLEITEQTDGRYELLWKAPSRAGMAFKIAPVLPEQCRDQVAPFRKQSSGSLVERRIIACGKTERFNVQHRLCHRHRLSAWTGDRHRPDSSLANGSVPVARRRRLHCDGWHLFSVESNRMSAGMHAAIKKRSRRLPAMIHSRYWCLSVIFFWPGCANAHLVNTGFGPFYDGILHPAVSPDDLLSVLALALLAGLGGARNGRTVLFTVTAAWLMAGLLGCR